MRKKISDQLVLFNGKDGEFLAEISAVAKKEVVVTLLKMLRPQLNEPDLWLLFAPIKHGRIDYLVAKATELGVAEIFPVITERTIVERVNIERLQANCIAAAELSERLTVPKIHHDIKLGKTISSWSADRNLILCDESGKAQMIRKILENSDKNHKWAILIGPEGGFTEKEFKILYDLPYVYPASLGKRVMRADTAAIAALSIWQAHMGDWE